MYDRIDRFTTAGEHPLVVFAARSLSPGGGFSCTAFVSVCVNCIGLNNIIHCLLVCLTPFAPKVCQATVPSKSAVFSPLVPFQSGLALRRLAGKPRTQSAPRLLCCADRYAEIRICSADKRPNPPRGANKRFRARSSWQFRRANASGCSILLIVAWKSRSGRRSLSSLLMSSRTHFAIATSTLRPASRVFKGCTVRIVQIMAGVRQYRTKFHAL